MDARRLDRRETEMESAGRSLMAAPAPECCLSRGSEGTRLGVMRRREVGEACGQRWSVQRLWSRWMGSSSACRRLVECMWSARGDERGGEAGGGRARPPWPSPPSHRRRVSTRRCAFTAARCEFCDSKGRQSPRDAPIQTLQSAASTIGPRTRAHSLGALKLALEVACTLDARRPAPSLRRSHQGHTARALPLRSLGLRLARLVSSVAVVRTTSSRA